MLVPFDQLLADARAGGYAVGYFEPWDIYSMEAVAEAAHPAGVAVDAEEAFLEALAHDAGSVRGALGLWALCDRLGRSEEAARYLKLAQRVWAKANPKDFAALQSDMAKRATKIAKPAVTAMGDE